MHLNGSGFRKAQKCKEEIGNKLLCGEGNIFFWGGGGSDIGNFLENCQNPGNNVLNVQKYYGTNFLFLLDLID